MKLANFSLACAALALGTSAALAEGGTWSATVGASAFNGPDGQTGVYNLSGATSTGGLTVDAMGLGISLGIDASIPIGLHGDMETALRIYAFGMLGHASGSVTNTYTGSGVVVIPGYTTPGGTTIALATNSGASTASSTITHTNPQGGVANSAVAAAAATQNLYGVTIAPGSNSFSYAGASVGAGGVVAAYGAVGATDGGIFIAAGDLTGLAITTSFVQDVIYLGKDITLALSGDHGDWSVTGYAGPSYRFLGQRNTTNVAVDIPELEPAAGILFPDYSMNRVEDLTSHYLGGVVGGEISTAVSATTTLTLGAEGGLYYTIDSLSGRESYTVANGQLVPVPSTTVDNANTAAGSANGLAFAARGNAAFTVSLAENRQITFGGQVEYLSRVATVTRPSSAPALTNTYVAGSSTGTVTYDTVASSAPILSFGDMWNFTGTISFTGQF
jgi:hypothetical protein